MINLLEDKANKSKIILEKFYVWCVKILDTYNK